MTWREFMARLNNLPADSMYRMKVDQYNEVKKIENNPLDYMW